MKANKLAVLIIASAVAFGALIFAFSSPISVNSPSQGLNSFSTPSSSYGNVVILQNGSLSVPSAPISINGNYYNLTGNLAGSITVERNNITLDGQGFSIDNQSVPGGFGVMLYNVNRVTVTGIKVVNLSGSTYSDNTKGIYLNGSNNNTIVSNSVSGGIYGIKLDASNNNIISGNTASYNMYGAYICQDSLQNHVFDNDFSHSINDGIYLCSSYNSTLNGNDLSYSQQRGIYVGNTSHDEIYGNNASYTKWGVYMDGYSNSNNLRNNNFSSTSTGIYTQNGYNNTFSSNDISSTTSYGIDLVGSRNTVITGNDLSGGSIGINLTSSKSLQISGNTLTYESSAIVLSGSQNNEIYMNDFSGSGNGIILSDSLGNAMYNNTANSVSGTAVSLDLSNGNTISNSAFSGSGLYGIFMSSSRNNTVLSNAIENGDYGIYLSASQHNQVYNNTLSGNANYDIFLSGSNNNSFYGNEVNAGAYSFSITGSSFNTFYHNNFMINGSQWNLGSGSANYWDYGYPTGGNYWSNYTGSDNYMGPGQNVSGSDGIGDTPYVLNANNIDHYPLMAMWQNHFAVFNAIGLSPGTEWSVTFNNTTLASVADQISFLIPQIEPANYSYSIGPVIGFVPATTSGTVNYSGSTVYIYVTFIQLYNVSFVESGLAAGTSWAVSIDGTNQSSTAMYMNFSLMNGTYNYSISPVGGYFLSSYTGQVTVDGSDVVVPVEWKTFNLTVEFKETGLPSGTQWQVVFNSQQKSSSTDSIQFQAPNGTYSYSVKPIAGYYLDSYSGSATVDGSNVQVSIGWKVFTYSVIFTSSGLPSGHSWSVVLDSTQQASAQNNIGFNKANGTYAYTINPIQGYHASTYSGTVSVTGGNAQVTVTWTQVKYKASINQNGLASGTEWWLNITGGASYHSTGSSITIDLPNGTFAYTISAGGYTATPSSGNITVSGADPANLSVSFSKEQTQGGFPVWYWYIIGGVIVVVAAGVIIYLVRRPKSP